MADPNKYWGSGSGGTQVNRVNVVAAFAVDNTGATDCSGNLQKALNALAAAAVLFTAAQVAWIPAGTYKVAQEILLPSNLVIEGSPGAQILGDALAGWLLRGNYTTSSGSTTLAANTGVGNLTISLTNNVTSDGTPIVQGSTILVLNAVALGQMYQVAAISAGPAPYTVTLDRPILQMLAAAGSVVSVVTSRPTNIRILGNGMRMGGGAWRWLDIMGGLHCYASDINVDASGCLAGNYAVSMDLYGFKNTLERIDVYGGGNNNVAAGVATESNERTQLIDCVVADGSTIGNAAGIMITNGVDVEIRGCSATGCVNGIVTCCDFTATGRSWRTQIIGGAYSGNQYGGLIDGGTVYPGGSTGTVAEGTSFAANQISGLRVVTGAVAAHLKDIDVSQNGLSGASLAYLALAASTVVDGLRCSQADNGGQIVVCTGGTSYLSRLEVGVTSANNSTIVVYANGASLVKVRDLHVTVAAAAGVQAVVGAYCAANVLDIDTMTMDGAGVAGGAVEGIVSVAGTTVRLNGRIDVDAAGIPHSIAGYCSRSLNDAAPNAPVVANGAVAVDVPWTDLKTTDRVILTMSAKGGAPSACPLVTYTPGVKFTLTSFAGDTSSYNYAVAE